MQFGQDFDRQNLHWSSELLENSCEQDLSSTTDAVRAIKHRVTTLCISSFEGKNVSTVVSQFRSAISRLTFLNKFPHHTVPKLLEVFQSSSVPLFNDVFRF